MTERLTDEEYFGMIGGDMHFELPKKPNPNNPTPTKPIIRKEKQEKEKKHIKKTGK